MSIRTPDTFCGEAKGARRDLQNANEVNDVVPDVSPDPDTITDGVIHAAYLEERVRIADTCEFAQTGMCALAAAGYLAPAPSAGFVEAAKAKINRNQEELGDIF